MKPLGLGAIGSGEIAINSIFKHIELHDADDKVCLAAVCDPVPGRAEAMAEKYGIKKWYLTDDELLADPALKVWEVSDAVGFADVTHFSRIFKKLENMSANEYRNKQITK